ncbi:hypothetical protein EVAR_58211_1 [Eumeta japonica]|uniref:Uncharacterized protein n=1 Tax=Eumeta variegata TaxID=151549 RepID=A0A4C1YPP5_EUMVA|nr:hypothetical protein EVAR_58211_1 [Eumeta japonica]
MSREWRLDELAAIADAELRAAAAHAHRHRSLVALCHRFAPHHYLPLSAVACCPLCGGRGDTQCANAPAPPPRGRGHLPRMAPAAPLDVGQWARVQSVAMVTKYP